MKQIRIRLAEMIRFQNTGKNGEKLAKKIPLEKRNHQILKGGSTDHKSDEKIKFTLCSKKTHLF